MKTPDQQTAEMLRSAAEAVERKDYFTVGNLINAVRIRILRAINEEATGKTLEEQGRPFPLDWEGSLADHKVTPGCGVYNEGYSDLDHNANNVKRTL